MKKLSIVTILVLATIASFSFKSGKLFTPTVDTFINKQTVSSSSTLYKTLGGFRPDSALILPFQFFADTAAANYSKAAGYNGSLILIGTSFYYRTLNPNKWNLISIGGSTGTVTSIATNNGTGISGGTITATGTLVIDTTNLSTRLWRQKAVDSLNTLINLRVKYTDTSSMLSGYARSGNVPAQFNLSVNAPIAKSGTYPNITVLADTGRAAAELVTGGSLNKVRDSLQANITAAISGVSSFSFTNANGISGVVTNPTSTPNLTLSLGAITPTSVNSSGAITGTTIAGNLVSALTFGNGLTSTASSYNNSTPLTLKVDTTIISTKANVTASLLGKLNISDTAAMLANRLKISDTATMLSGYTRVQRFTDSLTAVQGRIQTKVYYADSLSGGYTTWKLTKKKVDSLGAIIGTKGTGTITSVGLSFPSFITISNSPITSSGSIVGTLANQSANTFFGGGTSGSAAQPTFRALVAADLPITISGTQNYIPKFTGSSSIGNSTIYQDQTSGFIGINNISPLSQLDVRGVSSRFANSTGESMVYIRQGATTGNTFGEIDALINSGAGYGNLIFQKDSSNVGINTGSSAPANTLQIGSVGSTGYAQNKFTIGNGTEAYAINPDSIYNTYTTSSHSFWTNGNQRAKIFKSGKFLINDLSGSGSRMVIADANGILGTQTIPSGGVTSVSAGTGMNFTTITSSGSVNADTTILSTKANVIASLLPKLNLSDTASMLSNRLKISDTATMLSNRLKISDTLTMLGGYLRTASNGITKTNQNIVLGGLLNQNTIITDSTFSMLFTNTKKINNGSKFGVNGEMNLIGVTNDDNTQVIYSGLYGSQSWTSAATYNLNARAIYSANNGTNYLANAGAINGSAPISASSGWLLMSNTGDIANLATFHAKTPLQQVSGTTMTGKVTTYGSFTIDNLRDSSDVQSKFQNMYAINQKGTHDTSLFNGIISGNIINATTLGGTLSTAAQSNITSLGTLTGLNVTGNNLLTFQRTGAGTTLKVDNTTQFTQLDFANNGTAKTNLYWDNTAGTFSIFTSALAAVWTGSSLTLPSLGTGTVYSNAGTLTNTNPSDSTMKNTITPFSYGLKEVIKLSPKTYYYNTDSSKSYLKYGFLAQDVQKVMPDVVRKLNPKDSLSKLGLESDGIYVAAIKSIQELNEIVEDKQKQIDELKTKYEALLQRIIKLEKK